MRIATISFIFAMLCIAFLSRCNKQGEDRVQPQPTPLPSDEAIKYTIKKGDQFCDKTSFVAVSYTELKFTVKFDNSAMYQTVDPANQEDINKLYGFSDNNSPHQEYSARFGWNWCRDSLRLYAYTYNAGVRDSKEIGSIIPATKYNCSIKVDGNAYIFTLDNKTVSMPRTSTTAKAEGYKLYPYFGGNETAPHDIFIWIHDF